ncbi:unnamed protein product [Mytilus coruscus]|uniref:Protein kinase domain-containing protein n=1 Tax=Mytilus coruscus TaxID=42192 RepID=A0A6J8BIF8_MYTCO|nr:unnamed protein product [Mytilus coruscus]
MVAFTVTDKYKITVRGKHGKYSSIIEKDFTYDELGNTVESDKEQHIEDMITANRKKKKNPKNDSKKVEKKRSDGEENTVMNTLKRKHNETYTRSKNPKVHIGWQHYKAGQYKQVFKADGGNVRHLPISTLDLEIDDVILLGTDVFYPDGKFKYGHLKEMEIYLADASSQKLTFERVNETKPNLGNYLRFKGLQLSKCTFYLMTKLRNDQSYYRERLSKYSEETSIISCSSIRQCKYITFFDEPVAVDEVYNPCDNGFSICSIQIGGKDFIDTKCERIDGVLKRTTRYPSAGINIDGIIIHEALEIWGYDEDNFLIGLVIGTTENVLYTWFKDNVMISSGSMNIIVVTQPGIYSCEVSFADIKQLSKAVQIIAFSDINETTSDSLTKTISYACSHPSSSMTTSQNSALQSTKIIVEDLNIDYSSIVGRITFGTVYKGKWTGLEVAVKAIPIKKRAKTAMLRTVEKEINKNSKLRHPNIIQFLAVARADTTIYLVHEFIMGCNMEDVIFSEKTKLDIDIKDRDKPHIMKQVVQAVSYMHSLEPVVLHHDIKPGNILIRKGCLTTKVCDMGIGRLKSVGAAMTTTVGSTFGTRMFAPTRKYIPVYRHVVTRCNFYRVFHALLVDDEGCSH